MPTPPRPRPLASALALQLAGCVATPPPPRPVATPVPSAEQLAADLDLLLSPDPAVLAPVLQRAAASRDRRFIAPLIELVRFRPAVDLEGALYALTGAQPGRRWNDWYVWMGEHP